MNVPPDTWMGEFINVWTDVLIDSLAVAMDGVGVEILANVEVVVSTPVVINLEFAPSL